MSPSGLSDGGALPQMAVLRQTIARIEGGRLWPAFGENQLGTGRLGENPPGASSPDGGRCALGRDLALDRVLRGGLPRGTLSEVVAGRPGDAGAASGFALALAARFAAAAGGPVVWVIEDSARGETGAPYAPGLAAHGVDPAHLIVVRTKKRRRQPVGDGRSPEMPGRRRRGARSLAHQGLRPRRLAPPGARRGRERNAGHFGAGRGARHSPPPVVRCTGPLRGRGRAGPSGRRPHAAPRPSRLVGAPRAHPRRPDGHRRRRRLGKALAPRLGSRRDMLL